MLSCSLDLKRERKNITTLTTPSASGEQWRRHSPVPVGLSNCGVVDNSGQQCREGPEQQSGQELADEGTLEEGKTKHKRWMVV